ncbi:MAG: tRNA lysidine(34) synthetase TilS [Ectothiorhodospiraceae bacterium]|nr:tRNA lysidine(34) synthetase TilS [Ectothiorhodospiraceae bacterium]
MHHALDPELLLERVSRIGRCRGLVVAYSGGVDSHVLLHALARCGDALPGPLRAMHVDHGLHPESPRWAEHCSDVCQDLDVPLQVFRVQVPDGPSLEAQARYARYAAFEAHLASGEYLLTGHHLDDQMETVLLRILRGAGVDGLVAMQSRRHLGQGELLRPLLDVARARILAYGELHALQWIEDPANRDQRHDRNFLRSQVLPLLRQRWPGVDRTLAGLAAQALETRGLLDALAEADGLGSGATVDCAGLRALPEARARNLLRAWLRRLGLPMPPRARLRQGLRDLLHAGEDRHPCLRWPGGRLRRYGDALYADEGVDPPPLEGEVSWHGEPRLLLPAGVLHSEPGPEGLDPAVVRAGLELGARRPGERCRPVGRGERPVKKLLQEAAIPPWLRSRWPVLRRGGTVVAIPGVCVCQGFQVPPGESGLVLAWEPRG